MDPRLDSFDSFFSGSEVALLSGVNAVKVVCGAGAVGFAVECTPATIEAAVVDGGAGAGTGVGAGKGVLSALDGALVAAAVVAFFFLFAFVLFCGCFFRSSSC